MLHANYERSASQKLPDVKKVDIGSPVKWLDEGWQDFMHMPLYSSFYGLVLVLMGYGIIVATYQTPILFLAFLSGFFLISPFLALGLYHLSHQKETGNNTSLWDSIVAIKEHKLDMVLLAILHGLLLVAWIGLSTIMSDIYFTHIDVSLVGMFEYMSTEQGLGMLLMFMGTGAVLALLVFVTSLVSWPMLLERRCSIFVAISTSIRAVLQNKLVTMIWASFIVGLVSAGMASALLGLIVVLPVLGHATWHAYRDLVI